MLCIANVHPDRDFQWLLWCTKPGTFGGSCTAYNKRQSMTEISSADIMSIALNLLNWLENIDWIIRWDVAAMPGSMLLEKVAAKMDQNS